MLIKENVSECSVINRKNLVYFPGNAIFGKPKKAISQTSWSFSILQGLYGSYSFGAYLSSDLEDVMKSDWLLHLSQESSFPFLQL